MRSFGKKAKKGQQHSMGNRLGKVMEGKLRTDIKGGTIDPEFRASIEIQNQ